MQIYILKPRVEVLFVRSLIMEDHSMIIHCDYFGLTCTVADAVPGLGQQEGHADGAGRLPVRGRVPVERGVYISCCVA